MRPLKVIPRTGLYAESHGIVANVRHRPVLPWSHLDLGNVRTFGTLRRTLSSTTTGSNHVGGLTGGSASRCVPSAYKFVMSLRWQKMWETVNKAGMISANLMW
jgi:hypothetical protein